MIKQFKLDVAGKEMIVETGRMAKQADGAVTMQLGGTVVLVTAVCSKNPRVGADFLPLFVEYQERMYAGGKIPGGFFKREGRPTEKAILTSRLIDRPIRPLFPKGMTNEIQVMCMVMSSDLENDSDILAVNGTSFALTLSNIPFDGPIGAVRIGRVNGEFIVNPTFMELEESALDLVVVGRGDDVIMLESGATELSEEIVFEAITLAQKHIKEIIAVQVKLAKEMGITKRDVTIQAVTEEVIAKVKELASAKLKDVLAISLKDQRAEAAAALKKEIIEALVTDESGISEADVKEAFGKIEKGLIRDTIVNEGKRTDGRQKTEIREITCEVGLLPRAHGSGLFTRGETQSLAVTTLGTADDEQRIDSLEGDATKSFMLHYNFPPFSVGEVKPVRGPGRREIGHGALAERAIKPIMPSKDDFPYTVRLVSEILESNGSSSMATVCASTLALMDAGVPIKKPVSGIAMGLVKEGDKYLILTDIAGAEDHFGDMDFKVAGTRDGITAVQMDLKVKGVSLPLIKEILAQAKDARMEIMDKIEAVIANPNANLSSYAPRIESFKIDTEKIRDVIGSGGKVIRKIIADTGASINVEDDGTVQVASPDREALDKAVAIIQGIVQDPEVGKIYDATVKRIMDFGAFVEILPGKEGLCHVSELSTEYVKNPSDIAKVGDQFQVKLLEIDSMGRLNLSKNATDPNYVPKPKPERKGHSGGDRNRSFDKNKKRF